MKRRTLSLVLATGILLTVSISYAAYSVEKDNVNKLPPAKPGAVQVLNQTNYLSSYLFQNLACEGIHYYSEGDALLHPGNVIPNGQDEKTHLDDFLITFRSKNSQPALAQVVQQLDGNSGHTATVDFIFTFPSASNVNVASLAENGLAYFRYRTLEDINNDRLFPLCNWFVSNDALSDAGNEVSYLRSDAAEKTLTLSVLLTDHALGTIDGNPYLYSLADILIDHISYNDQYTLILDLDLSKETGLTSNDFSGITLSINVSKETA